MNKRKLLGIMIGFSISLGIFVAFTILLFNSELNKSNNQLIVKHIKDAVEINNTDTKSVSDGTLITLSGHPKTTEILYDGLFRVEAPKNALKMTRTTYQYQWMEEASKDSQSTNYLYAKGWDSKIIQSEFFHDKIGHENPETMIYSNEMYVVKNLSIGSYDIDKEFIEQINAYKKFNILKSADIENVTVVENEIFISATGKSTLLNPEIGDYKIVYTIVAPENITVLGAKKAENIISYQTEIVKIALVSLGVISKDTLIKDILKNNTDRVWALRVISIIMFFISTMITILLASNKTGKIPILGIYAKNKRLRISAIICSGWWLIVVGLCWLSSEPIISAGLFFIVAVEFYLLSIMKQSNIYIKINNKKRLEEV